MAGSPIGRASSISTGASSWNLIQHIWPVIAVATFGGLAYNMRVMRANLLDTLNAQYVETARAKGLGEGAVIMRHAVPNALHPLVAYQGVVLPYMLTGEIEVAIVFGLATIGPAIVGSMAHRRRLRDRDAAAGAGRHADRRQHHRRPAAGGARSAHPGGGMTHDRASIEGEAADDRLSDRLHRPRKAIAALVWRRFRKSIPGMMGLVAGVAAAS